MRTAGTVLVLVGGLAAVGAYGDATADGAGTAMRDQVKTHAVGATNDVSTVLVNGLANAAGLISVLREAWASLGISVAPAAPAAPAAPVDPSGTQIYTGR